MTTTLNAHLLREAATLISQADYLFITAGAGMSADSGLKTFAQVNNLASPYCV